ncbi:MAG: TetR/AcrR family transcriptional regulator [Candidatus Cyclobacteriaceae bacterium M3_2C_046]
MEKTEKKAYNARRILETSKDLFYTFGYSKVTMDDISKKLGMSKKTLYKYFDGKYQIMERIVADFKKDMSTGVDKIINDESLDFPIKLKEMLNLVAKQLSHISPLLMEDMQQNLPVLWEELNNHKKEGAYKRFNRLIEEGRQKSMINSHINHKLIVVFYASAIQNLLDPNFMHQIPQEILEEMPKSPAQIFDNLINLIYEGILREETKEDYREQVRKSRVSDFD